MSTYDNSVPYPSFVFDHIRPEHIGAVAALHGIRRNDVSDCCVLELGCGDGANLLSIAYAMPASRCVGVDLSAQRISEAKAVAARIGVKNATFCNMDVMDFTPEEFGKFDFIIAHGLYSWIPEEVRERVLSIYRTCLKPDGVGYISYNAYPGWHMRNVLRDAMRFHSGNITDPTEKMDASLNFLQFLCETSRAGSVYRSYLEEERDSMSKRYKAALLHDDLNELNQPFYFRDFVESISKHRLRFVAEAEPVAFFDNPLPQFARDLLEQLWDDPVRREQYLDFIRCTRFRSTLVCHEVAEPSYRPLVGAIDALFLSTRSEPKSESPVFSDESEVIFTGPRDTEFSTNHPFTKMALHILGSRRPESSSFESLSERLRNCFPALSQSEMDAETAQLKTYMLELIHSSIVEARCFVPEFSKAVSQHPKMSAFARWQAETGFDYVTSVTGKSLAIKNQLVRAMISLLDGSRDRSKLVADLLHQVSVQPTQQKTFEANLPEMVDDNLNIFVKSAMLIA